ncbi:DinB family protein [Chryseosolibacter indicus]|uniref:DinB family protein n=1 Tax=Chryseosolibacter indicus TaxID=2782351 RepID=A0ABS5VLQ3_9BACT|nr:DinB family protein [Chryseosolibacter indicus]MBT1702377.1 DinB family protein [Chryseosolibacter indicus]
MTSIANELRSITEEFFVKLDAISEGDFSYKALPNKWSKKEILGHLIDSAQNNIRRFICGQYETTPSTIVYNQDFWFLANGYQKGDSKEIITLWKLLNLRICDVLAIMPTENHSKTSNNGSDHTIKWLAEDYLRHLKHHLNQIIAGSFN